MASPGSVVLNFVAKTKDAISNVNKLTRSLGKVDDDGAKPASTGLGKLAGSLGTVLPIAGAVAGAAVGLAAGLWEAGQAAMEDKKQADKLADTLRRIPGVTDAAIRANADWIDSMELATGLADTDWRTAISKLALATGDLATAQTLAQLTADAAVASGKNWSSITDAMAKAANGNTAALQRMFPWLDANKDGTVTYAEAVQGLTDKFKGASKAAADNDPFKRLATIWDQLKEAVGQALVPLIDKFGKWISKKSTQDMIERLITKVTELATAFGDDLAKAAEDVIDWLSKPENQKQLKEWAALAGNLARAMSNAAGQVGRLIGALERMPKIPQWARGLLGRGLGAGGGLILGPTTAAPSAGGHATGATQVTINITGVSDPYTAARLATQQAARFAAVQGRATAAPVPAW